jgi:hypothetical protein
MKTKDNTDLPDGAMKLRSGLKTRQFGLDFGIYDSEEKITYLLNPTASLILNYLPTGKSHREIALNVHVSYLKSKASPARVMHDLYKTIQFLQKMKLIEELKEGHDKGIPKDIAFTEFQMTRLPLPYLPPIIRGFSEEQMEDIKNPSVSFADTWNPTSYPTMFADTWNPNMNPATFADTWNPTSNPAMFADTWNPTSNPAMFADTWNPNSNPAMFADTWNPNMNPAMFADTWNPNMNPAMFADTWNPNINPKVAFHNKMNPNRYQKQPGYYENRRQTNIGPPRAMFSDTWNPTATHIPSVRFLDTWNPTQHFSQPMFVDTWVTEKFQNKKSTKKSTTIKKTEDTKKDKKE